MTLIGDVCAVAGVLVLAIIAVVLGSISDRLTSISEELKKK